MDWLILTLFLVRGWCFVLLFALSSLRFLQTRPGWSMRRLCTWRERARVLPEEIEVAQGKIDELWTYFFSSQMCHRVLSAFSFDWFFSVYCTVKALKLKSWQDKTYGIERDPFCFSASTIFNCGFLRGGSWVLFWQILNGQSTKHWEYRTRKELEHGTSERTRSIFTLTVIQSMNQSIEEYRRKLMCSGLMKLTDRPIKVEIFPDKKNWWKNFSSDKKKCSLYSRTLKLRSRRPWSSTISDRTALNQQINQSINQSENRLRVWAQQKCPLKIQSDKLAWRKKCEISKPLPTQQT